MQRSLWAEVRLLCCLTSNNSQLFGERKDSLVSWAHIDLQKLMTHVCCYVWFFYSSFLFLCSKEYERFIQATVCLLSLNSLIWTFVKYDVHLQSEESKREHGREGWRTWTFAAEPLLFSPNESLQPGVKPKISARLFQKAKMWNMRMSTPFVLLLFCCWRNLNCLFLYGCIHRLFYVFKLKQFIIQKVKGGAGTSTLDQCCTLNSLHSKRRHLPSTCLICYWTRTS